MLGIEKIFIAGTKDEYDVTAIARDLKDITSYKINVRLGDCDGIDVIVKNLPMFVLGERIMIGDIEEVENAGITYHNKSYEVYDVDKKRNLTLKYATLVAKVLIV